MAAQPNKRLQQTQAQVDEVRNILVPTFKKNIASRPFSVAAPTLCNSFPDNVTSANTMTFRRQLKACLF